MPVIQLPRDTRWAEIGQGLEKGLTALIEGYQDRQASQGVAQIMQDPNIAETKRPAEIYKQFGSLGLQKYKEAITLDVLQATAAEKRAAAVKDLAASAAAGGQNDLTRLLFGLGPAPATPAVPGGPAPPAPTASGAGAVADALRGSTPAAAATAPSAAAATTPQSNAVVSALGGAPAAAAPASGAPATDRFGEAAPTGYELLPGGGMRALPPASSTPATPPTPLTVPPPNLSMQPSAAPAPVPPAASTTPSAVAASPISRIIDQRAKASNVTFSPEEKDTLILESATHVKKDGPGAALTPIYKAIEAKQKGQEFPFQLRKIEAEAKGAEASASTAQSQADLALAKNKQELVNLQTASQYLPETAKAGATKLIAEAGRAQQLTAAGVPYDVPQQELAASFPSLTPEQRQTLGVVGKSEGAAKFAQTLQQFVAANTDASRKQVPQFVTDVAAMLPAIHSYENMMTTLETHPGMNGGPISGVIAPWLAKYGLDIIGLAPPEVLSQLAQSEQLALQTLQGHHGLGGQYLVPFVSATMPSAAKSKIFSAVETNVKAEDYLAKLGSMRTAYQAAGMDTAQVDEAIGAAQKLHDRTSTLWWTGATPGQNSRVFYKGQEINPDTWQPVQGGAKEFQPQENINFGGNRSMSGADINKLARESGRLPEVVRAELAAKWGQ